MRVVKDKGLVHILWKAHSNGDETVCTGIKHPSTHSVGIATCLDCVYRAYIEWAPRSILSMTLKKTRIGMHVQPAPGKRIEGCCNVFAVFNEVLALGVSWGRRDGGDANKRGGEVFC